MANLYTKTGDTGQTGLLGGSRVSKGDLRVECYGGLDEANSMLGLAKCQTKRDYVSQSLQTIQERLFVLGAELASDEKGAVLLKERINDADIHFLERLIDTCTETISPQGEFVVPGTNPVSAALHVARTVVRRTERSMVRLSQTAKVRLTLIRYANRLSDAVYALARYEETLYKQEILREEIKAMVEEKLLKLGFNFAPLNLENMQRVAKRAREKAAQMDTPIVFAAVDGGGNLILLERMEGSLLGSLDIAIHKAYTANAFKRPTHELGEAAQPGGELYGIEITNLGKVVLFGGGFPYIVEGQVVGGIGISGGTVEEDIRIARYALQLP